MSELIGYVTIEEANSYISSRFLSTDDKRTRWEALGDEDKKALLYQSLDEIEKVNFSGFKTDRNQELAFPRNGNKEVPSNVKTAQIVGAIDRLNDNDAYAAIISGIKSESLGSASYSYSDTASINKSCRPAVYSLLKGYIKKIYKFI